jgi:hypothetical protein
VEVLWITLDWSEDAAPCPVAVVEASLKRVLFTDLRITRERHCFD